MDEDLQKRNTDCIYFLASPLTCKKGIECEYRHSEIARLNPRDCWYWMSGNCLNPTCGFRHPPLEKSAEVPSESSAMPPANRIAAPCYFFFNGFCNKGDRCLFSHGPDGNTSVVETPKPTSVPTVAVALENKTAQEIGLRSKPAVTDLHNSETTLKTAMGQKLQFRKDELQQPRKTVTEQNSFPPAVVTHHEEATTGMSDSLLQAHCESFACPDQSSEEQVDDHVDDRLESSPGFDVLVNDKYENLGYEDDQEYLVGLDGEQMDHSNGFLEYDYEHEVEYKPRELLYESNTSDSFDYEDGVHVIDDGEKDFGRSGDKMLVSLDSRKRKGLPIQQRVVDLRDRLTKRRISDGRSFDLTSRGHDFSSRHGIRSPEMHQRRGMSQRLHRRLSSEVRVNTIKSGNMNNSRLHYKGKRHLLSTEIRRKQVPREKRPTEASLSFTGPKSLAQIKEEKAAEEKNGMVSADFEGPKPLSEILKDKDRLGLQTDYANGESN